VATVGLSDHAQNSLGDIVYVELPEVGDEVDQDDSFGTVESTKAVSDVYAPVAGEVIEVNDAVTEDPALVNQSPLEEGWLAKFKIADGAGDNLMSPDEYAEFCKDL